MEKTISQKITELRKAAGLTQEQLGERLGISGQAVSKWERGEAMPDILLLSELCKTLSTTLDSLLGAKHADNPSVMTDFCEYAVKNGRAKTVREAISRLMNREIVAPKLTDGLCVALENGKNVLVSDSLGMGFVMNGTEFSDYCLDMDYSRITGFLNLITDEKTFSVIKTVARGTSTLQEICSATGLDELSAKGILLELSNCAIVALSVDRNGKKGYCPACGMVAVWLVLSGCSLLGGGCVRGSSWLSV